MPDFADIHEEEVEVSFLMTEADFDSERAIRAYVDPENVRIARADEQVIILPRLHIGRCLNGIVILKSVIRTLWRFIEALGRTPVAIGPVAIITFLSLVEIAISTIGCKSAAQDVCPKLIAVLGASEAGDLEEDIRVRLSILIGQTFVVIDGL